MCLDFRLGFSAWLLTGSLPERFTFLADCGFDSVSLLQSVIDCDPGERREGAMVIRERELGLTYHGNVQANLKNGRLDENFTAKLLDDVLWWHENAAPVHSCCSDRIILHNPDGSKNYLAEDTLALFKMQADAFSGRNIGFGIENGDSSPDIHSLPVIQINELYQAMGKIPGAGMLFDVGHANIHATCPIDAFIEQLPFRIHEVHISDNHGTADEHLPPGCGNINYGVLRRGLEAKGFNGVITLEFCPAIQAGRYAWDLNSMEEREVVLESRSRFLNLFES